MARGIVAGLVESGKVRPSDVSVCDVVKEKSEALSQDFGVVDLGSDYDKLTGHDVVVLAVKPQDAAEALGALKHHLENNTILISIVAGLTRKRIRELLEKDNPIVRVMPNLAVRVGAAVSAYTTESGTEAEKITKELLGSVGKVISVDEELMDLVTAVSGSGPAYFFLMVEALQEAAERAGMDEETASMLAEQTFWGAALILREGEKGPEELRKAVSSPGGTTLAALDILEKKGFRDAIFEAVIAAKGRAQELST